MTSSAKPIGKQPLAILIAFLVVTLCFCGCVRRQQPAQAPPSPKPAAKQAKKTHPNIAPWDKLQAQLEADAKSQTYQEGGKFLVKSAPPPRSDSQEGGALRFRLTVDFVRSITPEQYKVMKETGKVTFSNLTPAQQKLLVRRSALDPTSPLHTNPQNSYISITQYTQPDGKLLLQFNWMVAGEEGMGGFGSDL